MKEEEVKIRRLMQKCEDWLSDKIHDGTGNDKWWRLDQYITTLDSRIRQLETPNSDIDNDVLVSFKQNLQVLKQVVHKAKDDHDKSQQQFSANRSSILHEQSQKHSMEISNASKQLLHRVANKKEAELRNELFGRSISSSSAGMSSSDSGRQSLRHRDVLAENIEAVLESHQHMQDKLAEEMITMAKSLKNNSLIARDIIRGDTKTLTKTTELAEENIEKLGTETKRLKKHSINACSCGIWIMLLFVFIVFFFMILFIRIAPK